MIMLRATPNNFVRIRNNYIKTRNNYVTTHNYIRTSLYENNSKH